MEKYTAPEMKIVEFAAEDVITTSNEPPWYDDELD